MSQYTEEERELIDARMCVCNCGKSVAHRGVKTLYLENHRQNRHKRKVKAAATAAGLPANLSLETVSASSPTGVRSGDAPKPRQARKSGTSIRVSYRKAVEVLAERHGPDEARRLLEPLLTDRQRRTLKRDAA
jgi:hypothetical protein